LLWVGAIAVLVLGAFLISYAAEDRKDVQAEPPVDTDVFCQTAARFQSFTEIDLETGGSDQLKGLRLVATQLGSLSPTAIQKDFAAVGGALQNVASAVDAIPADDPAAIGVVTQKLDDELSQISEQADEAAAYIERWCGPRDQLGADATDPGAGPAAVPNGPAESTESPDGPPADAGVDTPG
jgi:hypothetical protein